MAHTARRFNAKEYRADAKDMMLVNPDMAAKSMTDLARRKVNQEVELEKADDATRDIIAFLVSLVVMGGAGAYMGAVKAKRDALIADWQVEGAESVGASLTEFEYPWDHERGVGDPTNVYYVPKLIAFPIVTGLFAAFAAAIRKGGKAGWFQRAMTVSAGSTFGLVIASVVSDFVYDSREKKLAAAEINSVLPPSQAVAS